MSISSHVTARPQTGRTIALVAVFAAFIAVCALLPAFPVGPAGVPITFQTLAIYLTALILGGKRGSAATALYVVVGLIGVPVFAGGAGGFGVLAGPSAGYLLAFAPAAALIGALAYVFLKRTRATGTRFGLLLVATLAGSALITLCGIAGMMINASLSLHAAVAAALIYLPGDLIKSVLAIIIATAVHRAIPALARS